MPFCSTIKDSEGKAINVGQQMDCNEFSNTLFDRIDTILKHTPYASFLRGKFLFYLLLVIYFDLFIYLFMLSYFFSFLFLL
jgi:hypothetical protein